MIKMLFNVISSNRFISVAEPPPPPPEVTQAAINATIASEVYYNGFGWPGVLNDGTIVGIYKRSSTHGSSGALMIARSTDGGATWYKNQISIGGAVSCTNLSLNVFDDRIIICYNQGSASNTYYFGYSDDGGETWLSGGSVTLSHSGYVSVVFSKPQLLPSGKILQAYYAIPIDNTVDPSLAGFIESLDRGETWAQGNLIASQMRKLPEESSNDAFAAGRGRFTEVCVAVTHEGETDGNTKMVAYLRNEDYGSFTHYYSANGGTTWTRSTNGLLSSFEPTSFRRPVHMINHGGTMYIICGNRKSGDYGIEHLTCTPDQLYANDRPNYGTVVRDYNCIADTNGSSNDCGYPEPFIDGAGQLVVWLYDTHPDYVAGVTAEWAELHQLVIVPSA